MKTSYPRLVSTCALLAAVVLSSACARKSTRETVRLRINRAVTHIAVGQQARLSAFQEYRQSADESGTVYAAAADEDLPRQPVTPRWSVSDDSLAAVGADGTLTALKPGRVTVRGGWAGHDADATIEVVQNLPGGSLPRLSASGGACQPQGVELSLGADRKLKFHLSYDNSECRDVRVEADAPDAPLPWEFAFYGGTLKLERARGPVVGGTVRAHDGSTVSFDAWADGAGRFPVSLAGKTVLLVGDSMAEGIGPFLRKKIEAAGGRFIGEPESSSTTIGWQGSGKFRDVIARHRPDIVFIALGSNEIFLKTPEVRVPVVKQMVAELGQRPAYWVGPPSWKPDNGLVRVIDESFQPGHFYNSNDLAVPRAKDGAHPTMSGYRTWTDLVWEWYAGTI